MGEATRFDRIVWWQSPLPGTMPCEGDACCRNCLAWDTGGDARVDCEVPSPCRLEPTMAVKIPEEWCMEWRPVPREYLLATE
jgi:hypothetical protein